MTNQKSILVAKCPSCGTPATQPEIYEICLRSKNTATDSFNTLLETCIKLNTLEKFHNNNEGEDPCMHCKYNQITEIPGSFIEMQQGSSTKSWLEIHVCPNCQTKYSINPQINAVKIIHS